MAYNCMLISANVGIVLYGCIEVECLEELHYLGNQSS